MLIEFSLGNYKSFKDVNTLSMVSTKKSELYHSNTFKVNNRLSLLKSCIIYGANASGKSNFFSGMDFFIRFIFTSAREINTTEKINVTSFKLNNDSEKKPSLFEAIFLHENIRYRYGFEVDSERIYREWLYYVPKTKETLLFFRNKNNFKIGAHFPEGKRLEDKTRNNALFLSVVVQFNGKISNKIFKWVSNFNVISGLDDKEYFLYSLSQLKNNQFKNKILIFLNIADLGIKDIYIEGAKIPQKNSDKPSSIITGEIKTSLSSQIGKRLNTIHTKYNHNKKELSVEKFNLFDEESKGTQKIFSLSGPLIDTLINGKILVIDELDARLHPLITKFIITFFHSKNINKKNAQLIIASHDSNMLKRDLFRRDQIWFTEKNKYEETDLYSLIEYKVRKDASYDKDYIQGKYGAIPFIGSIDELI